MTGARDLTQILMITFKHKNLGGIKMNNLHSIVYTSSAARDLNREDLAHLLQRSTERNFEEGITGILVFCEGKFIQYIEGPVAPLFCLYSRICTDTRHHDIIQLVNEPIFERFFC